jgi:dihydrofolate reductase
VNGLDEALDRARAAAGDKNVAIMGGADTIRQALAAGVVDEVSISIAPITLGGGKRLFERFTESIELEPIRVLQSPFATHITYRVRR